MSARWQVRLVPDEDGVILVRCTPPVGTPHYGVILRSGEVAYNRPLEVPRRVRRRAQEIARLVDPRESTD